MKIAIVHDMLYEFGGAERVLQALLTLFSKADFYVGFYNQKIVNEHFSHTVFHTVAQGTPLMSHSSLFQCLSPIIWKSINLSRYDVVISSTSYFLSHFVQVPCGKHIIYIHSPPKNIIGLIDKTPFQQIFPYEKYILPLYKHSLQKKNVTVLTNSFHMQDIIYRYFRLRPSVVYPPVTIPTRIDRYSKQNYYLMVNRLDREKNIELAIKACNLLQESLKIVGAPNDRGYETYLKKLAGPTIEFLGFKSDKDVAQLYRGAIAFLFTAKNEDFGIAPVEAMAHGVPVIAYFGGGVREYIVDKVTGCFFREHNPHSLAQAMLQLHRSNYHKAKLKKQAEKFSLDIFKENISAFL